MFRALTLARRRRHWMPPAGTTHVLTYAPGWLIEGGEPAEGSWAVESLASFLAGDSDVLGATVGPAAMHETDLSDFVLDTLGGEHYLMPFEVEVSDDDRAEMVPAYWLVPLEF